MGSLGATIQILAGWWDVYSHILFPGVDPWWNPAHLTLYTGIAIMIIAVWRGLRARPAQPTPAMVPIKFMNTAGLRLAAVGTVIEIVAGVWNEIVHRVVQSEPRIAPAHALLVVGMTTVAFGMVIGLTIEYGMIKRGFIPVGPATVDDAILFDFDFHLDLAGRCRRFRIPSRCLPGLVP